MPVHLQSALTDLGYHPGDLPIAENVAKEVLSLPMYPELDDEQCYFICDAIRIPRTTRS